jgi:sulfocyanin
MRFSEQRVLFTRREFIGAASCAVGGLLVGVRSDPEFMRYDAAARRVDLTVIAGFDQSNSGFNFNGGSHGSHRITVPAGWKVRLTFINRDVIPHSVVVARDQKQVPMYVTRPAFPGAASRAPQQGLPSGARQDDIVFVAGSPGAYVIACGIPGHAVLGSYIYFAVSSSATVPTYEMTSVSRR